MKFSKKGYLRNSPDVNKPQNIIKGGSITMKGVDFKVHGVDNNGYAKIMTPGYDYNFPNAKYVIETPIKNINMSSPFQKKFSAKSPLNPSPFRQEIDPTKLKYTTTETGKTLSGEIIPTQGTATYTIPATREVEQIASPEDYTRSFRPEFEKAQQEGFTGTLPEYIKEKESRLGYKPQVVDVTRQRAIQTEETQTPATPPERTWKNPFSGHNYDRYDLERNQRLKAAKQAGERLTAKQIIDLAKDVYGGFSHPYMAGWLQKNKLKLSKSKPKQKTSTPPSSSVSENITDYTYTVNPRSGN